MMTRSVLFALAKVGLETENPWMEDLNDSDLNPVL